MQGVKKAIRACVLFTVFMVIWFIFSLFVYANPLLWGKIGIPALPPKELFVPIYQVIGKMSEYAQLVIIFVLMVLWVVYKVINGLPGILQMLIGWVWSPWREVAEAGLFDLIDVIVGAMFSMETVDKRFAEVGIGLKNFLLLNSKMFGDDIISALELDKESESFQENKKDQDQDQDQGASSPMTDDELARQYDLYSQCIQENVVTATASMSTAEKMSLKAKNGIAQVNCKLAQFRQSMTVMSNRMSNN